LYGGFIGTETSRNERDWTSNLTILSGDINSDDNGTENITDNCYTVVTGANNSRLDGFTIRGGNAQEHGGGMRLTGSAAVENCIFEENFAISGGAIWDDGNSIISNCSFKNNTAQNGGAIYCIYPDSNTMISSITNCTFQENDAFKGGAIFNSNSSALINSVSFFLILLQYMVVQSAIIQGLTLQ
jgi:hypothetical protein